MGRALIGERKSMFPRPVLNSLKPALWWTISCGLSPPAPRVDRRTFSGAVYRGSSEEVMNWHRWLTALFVMLALVGCVPVPAGPGQAPNTPYQQDDPRGAGSMY